MADNLYTPSASSQNLGDIKGVNRPDTASNARVEIVKIPENLRNEPRERPQRIEGRVTRSDPQTNHVNIRTDRGDVEVKLPPRASLPTRGSDVELRLPPQTNSANNAATLKPLPVQPAVQNSADQVTLNAQKLTAPKTYPSSINHSGTQSAPQPLQIGQSIQLTPLSPAQTPLLQLGVSNITPVIQSLNALGANIVTPLNLNIAQNTGIQSSAIHQTPLNPILNAQQSPQALTFSNTVQQQTPNPNVTTLNVNINAAIPPNTTANLNITPTPSNILNTISAPITTPQPQIISPQHIQNYSAFLNVPNITPKLETMTPQSVQGIQNPATAPNQIPAHVIGTMPGGQSVIAIPNFNMSAPQNLFIASGINAPPGTIMTFSPAQITPAAQSSNMPLPQNINAMLQQPTWPALAETLEALQLSNPQIAQALSNILPSPRAPAQIPISALLFIAALKGGDLSAWMGERPLDLLKRLGKSELLGRLSADFQTLSRVSAEPLSNDWRGFTLPLYNDANLQNIAIFYRQEEQQNNDEQDTHKQTRFIFDMDLSRMGEVQIDGLFRKTEQDKRLEVILRTEAPISESMKQTLRQNYSAALKEIQINGELSFQSSKENYVTIIEREEKLKMST